MTRLHVSDQSPPIDVFTLAGEPITVPAATGDERLVHLQFRRFAGCPICNLHLPSVAQLGGEAAALRALMASVAAADLSLVAAKAALAAAESRYAAGQLSFAEADAARDAFIRVDGARRRFGLDASLALARLRIWSTLPARSGAVSP